MNRLHEGESCTRECRFDGTQKSCKAMTNEMWFCSLATKEKERFFRLFAYRRKMLGRRESLSDSLSFASRHLKQEEYDFLCQDSSVGAWLKETHHE